MGKIGEVVKEHDVEWEPAVPQPIAVPEPASPTPEPEPVAPVPELVPAGEPNDP